jgi:hypothetical protein
MYAKFLRPEGKVGNASPDRCGCTAELLEIQAQQLLTFHSIAESRYTPRTTSCKVTSILVSTIGSGGNLHQRLLDNYTVYTAVR